MEHNSTLEPDLAQPPKSYQGLSGEDVRSLAERELDATLQLLAERARYLCGASGVSIGLREGTAIICRASAGPSAIEPGSRIWTDSGLMGESVRLGQILHCGDMSGEIWRQLGIRSAMVGPLVRRGKTVGAFELLAERAHAFEESDVATLRRLSEMTLTALENFDAACRDCQDTDGSRAEAKPSETKSEIEVAVTASTALTAIPELRPQLAIALKNDQPQQDESRPLNVHQCQGCGFPISLSRTLCLDCEESQNSEGSLAPAHLFMVRESGWLQSHLYTVGTLFVAALTVALLVLKLK